MLTAAFCAMYNHAAENWNNLQRHVKKITVQNRAPMFDIGESLFKEIREYVKAALTEADYKKLGVSGFENFLDEGELKIIVFSLDPTGGWKLAKQGPDDNT
jgi:hypothetical protein